MTDFSISLSAYDRLLDLATELKAERDAARGQVARVEALCEAEGYPYSVRALMAAAIRRALAAEQPQERTQEPAGRDGSPGRPIRSGGAQNDAAQEGTA